MTTTGFAKEDVMFRTSSPERKKRRRVSKGRRRAIRWFRSPTRGDSAKKSMKTFSSETSILNKIGRQLFGESSSSRRSGGRDGKDVLNVSVHHETPVHLLPEEQLFADPSTQWGCGGVLEASQSLQILSLVTAQEVDFFVFRLLLRNHHGRSLECACDGVVRRIRCSHETRR